MLNQLGKMLELQNTINEKKSPDWLNADCRWERSAWIECAELLDHYGWKWWKKQLPDLEQVKLKLVNIWHFGLSILIRERVEPYAIVLHIEAAFEAEQGNVEFPDLLEAFVLDLLRTRTFSVSKFFQLTQHINFSYSELYSLYIENNVLNTFRLDNDYKTCRYVTRWGGQEDKSHLLRIAETLDRSDPNYFTSLYLGLQSCYDDLITKDKTIVKLKASGSLFEDSN